MKVKGMQRFLGGITKNYGTNYLLDNNSPWRKIEADASFRSLVQIISAYLLRLSQLPMPTTSTSMVQKRLISKSFRHYTELIQPGVLIIHRNLKMKPNPQEGVKTYTYDRNEGDFHAENIQIGNGHIVFDFVSPLGNISQVELMCRKHH